MIINENGQLVKPKTKKMKQTQALNSINFFTGGNKTTVAALAEKAVSNVFEKGNPLQVAESLSLMAEFIKAVKDNPEFINYVREEIAKHGKAYNSADGAKMELTEAGAKYFYDKTNDAEIESLTAEMEALKAKIKTREDFLKKIPESGLETINATTGEVVTLYRPYKTSTSTYKVTLVK